MSGRHAMGPEAAQKFEGSTLARTRMRVVLETIAGRKRVIDACEELGICEQRFEAIRADAIQAGVAALELKSAGRPRRSLSPADEQVEKLQRQIAELESQLQAAMIRAELAVTLPRLGREHGKKH